MTSTSLLIRKPLMKRTEEDELDSYLVGYLTQCMGELAGIVLSGQGFDEKLSLILAALFPLNLT